jgi:hypothetical protein
MDTLAEHSRTEPRAAWAGRYRAEIILAVAAFATLCLAVLIFAPQLVEPDDYAYQTSIVGITEGHWLTLSTAQANALSARLLNSTGNGRTVLRMGPPGPIQWVQLANGRWISEKDPGYPFLAAPFQALGIIRLAALFYAALGCLGLYAGAWRWLGRWGGTAAVALFCSSGAAMLFAWRDYMPTFTETSLIAAGTGALLWVLLATEASAERRTWTGLLGFLAIELAVFARYTNLVVLGCAVLTVLVAWRPRRVPTAALAWWLGSAVATVGGIALFNDLVYGGPLTSGYRPGEIRFSLSAIGANLRHMPMHLVEAIPMLLLGLAALAWIVARWLRLRRTDQTAAGQTAAGQTAAGQTAAGQTAAGQGAAGEARRDLAVAVPLAASWFGLWGLYATYTWTAGSFLTTLQAVRFYVDAISAIALLGAWLLTQLARRATLATATSAGLVVATFVLGFWSFTVMRTHPFADMGKVPAGHICHGHCQGPVRGP